MTSDQIAAIITAGVALAAAVAAWLRAQAAHTKIDKVAVDTAPLPPPAPPK